MTALRGRCVWVTGASSGIGRATTLALLDAGAHVIASARREDRLKTLRDACAAPERLHVLPMDVTVASSRQAAYAEAQRFGGGFDVLVHNAGIGQNARAEDTPVEVDRAVMEVNYFAPVALTKLCLPQLRARQAAQIVVVSSIVAYFAPPNRAAYAASKHALNGFFNALRAELSGDGIAVSVVCPGWVATEFRQHALSADGRPRPDAAPRGVAPERCASAILDVIRTRRRERTVGGPEVLTVYAQRFAPGLVSRALGHWKRDTR